MSGGAWDDFIKEHERLDAHVHELNDQINTNRLETAQLIERWDNAILGGDTDTADKVKVEVEEQEKN